MDLIVDAYDVYSEALNFRTEELQKYVIPIYARSKKDRPECVGTGNLISCGSKRFILTAAHVYDMAHLDSKKSLFIPGPTLTQLKPGTMVHHIGQGSQPNQYDLCVITVDDEIANALIETDKTFFDYIQALNRIQRFDASNFMVCVCGFPTSKQGAYKTSSDVGKYKMRPYSYRDKILNDQEFIAITSEHPTLISQNVRPDTHYMIRFIADRVEGTATRQGSMVFPSHHGMSGSGLWTLSHISMDAILANESKAELIGVFHSGIKHDEQTTLLLFTNNVVMNHMLHQILSNPVVPISSVIAELN
jgi:hypothetical protein